MAKIGRNAPCPCGSGKKYKRCHGALGNAAAFSSYSRPIPQEVVEALVRQEAVRERHEAEFGEVKQVITAEVGGTRFVASGGALHYSKKWKVFPDFLGNYLPSVLGEEWGKRQVRLAVEQQHPIVQWRTVLAHSQRGASPNERGLFSSNIGAANAWFRLAYDLYLIEHNAELQRKLLGRLRDPSHFQGARFEAAVAAMMLASGYDLRYAAEKGPGKHPEFYATHRASGQILAVEAKSRHRSGVLGFESTEVSQPPERLDIDRLLFKALSKDTVDPLLVFIEVNVPSTVDLRSPESVYSELMAAWTEAQERSWPNGFPAVGVVFYNDVSPWYLAEPLPTDGSTIWAFSLWPSVSRHTFDAKPLLNRIAKGCIQRSNIPLDFPSGYQ